MGQLIFDCRLPIFDWTSAFLQLVVRQIWHAPSCLRINAGLQAGGLFERGY